MQALRSLTWKTTNTDKKLLSLDIPERKALKPPQLVVHPFALDLDEIHEFIDALADAKDYMISFMPPEAPKGGVS